MFPKTNTGRKELFEPNLHECKALIVFPEERCVVTLSFVKRLGRAFPAHVCNCSLKYPSLCFGGSVSLMQSCSDMAHGEQSNAFIYSYYWQDFS